MWTIRLKASALYISIVISFIIAVITSSLILVAYFYRQEVLKYQRYSQLSVNLETAIAIMLSEEFTKASAKIDIDLYDEQKDSITLLRDFWGIYEIGAVQSFSHQDTLKKVFLIGVDTQESKEVLYLADEERPLSLNGSTIITGEAFLPEAGVRSAFVNGKAYTGKKLVNGPVKVSERSLPAFNKELLDALSSLLMFKNASEFPGLSSEMSNSFFNQTKTFYSGIQINNIIASGNIILISDTVVRVSKNAILKDVILCAPAFIIEDGFKGTCQIFARDSIVAGQGVTFDYPSALGIIKSANSKIQTKVSLGQNSRFNGILFTYESKRSDLQTIISLGKNTKVEGEVFSSGFLKLEKPVRINGKVSCNRFIIQTPLSMYENYLIDIVINRTKRSKYYLSSKLFNTANPKNKVLTWLN